MNEHIGNSFADSLRGLGLKNLLFNLAMRLRMRLSCGDSYITSAGPHKVVTTPADSFIVFMCNGVIHREYGPAVTRTRDGAAFWVRNGLRHREDGPAAIYPDGSQDWYLNDKPVRMEDVLDTPEKMEAYLLEESLRRL